MRIDVDDPSVGLLFGEHEQRCWQSWECFVSNTIPRVVGALERMGWSRNQAIDGATEALSELCLACLGRDAEIRHPKGWLLAVGSRWLCRSCGDREQVSIEADLELEDVRESPAGELEGDELCLKLSTIIESSMRGEELRVFRAILSAREDLSPREISQQTGVPVRNVPTYQSRGRERLRRSPLLQEFSVRFAQERPDSDL